MFSLIITIISIALVAALALATIYYGGSAFTEGGDAARAAQLINEGQQLQGANTLRKVQNAGASNVASISDLTGTNGYLSQAPAGGWGVTAAGFVAPAQNAEICNQVNMKAGFADNAVVDVATTPATVAEKVFYCDTVEQEVTYKF